MRKDYTLEEETNGAPLPGLPEAYPPLAPEPASPEAESPEAESRSLIWATLGVLLRRRWFIAGVTGLVAVAAVVISLLLPVWYAGSARVLMPESSGGGLGALIGELSPIGSTLLGGGGGDYTRYLALLTSRTTLERTVDRFDLVDVYDLAAEAHPREQAVRELTDNLEFEVDLQYDFLQITAFDQDPERAAALANFLVEELNRRNEALSAQNAANYRRYVEARYAGAEAELDSLRGEMLAFQEANGVVELPAMTQAFLEAAAAQHAQVVEVEIQYEALRAQYGDDNPQVQAARDVAQAARRSEERLLGGGEAVMPVPLQRLPALGSEYARLYQDLVIQAKIIEATRPLLEQARFEEQRDRVAVQVVDEAVAPTRKARPKRSILVILTTLSGFILTVLFVLLQDWLRRNRGAIARELQRA